MRGYDRFHRFALGIARERARGNRRQRFLDFGEQASVFSLKSSRSASRQPSGG